MVLRQRFPLDDILRILMQPRNTPVALVSAPRRRTVRHTRQYSP